MRVVNQYHIISFDQQFAENVTVTIEVDEKHTQKILEDVKNATSGDVVGKLTPRRKKN
jgi:putative IMPACT (imprinted ancient) family translation regulator